MGQKYTRVVIRRWCCKAVFWAYRAYKCMPHLKTAHGRAGRRGQGGTEQLVRVRAYDDLAYSVHMWANGIE